VRGWILVRFLFDRAGDIGLAAYPTGAAMMRCKADFGNYPNRLWSIPELATHIVSTYINLVRVIADARMNFAFRPKGELIDDVIRLSVRSGFAEILDGVSAQHYPITFKHLGRMVQKMESPITAADIQDFLRELEARLDDDIEDHEYIQVCRPQYYNQITPFGETVFNNLASANDDIYEAGMCLALNRGTACVMHLMRVMEAGLKALAGALSVKPQNDWGAYLREIDAKLDERYKKSGARSSDEQFYAEVALNMGIIPLTTV
jgi:hypothetical protein